MLFKILKLIRFKHWIKNLFIFVPLMFAVKFTDKGLVIKSVQVFFSFSFVASVIYIFNDIIDRKKDRAHPRKKNRPIASGEVSIGIAVLTGTIILLASEILAVFIGANILIVINAYLLLNFLYTIKLKNMVLIDVFVIAIGFVLRIAAGAICIEENLSNWILLTTFYISLFLGFGKRRCELELEGNGRDHRPVLNHYNIVFLNSLIIVSLTLTIITYSLYVVDPKVVLKFGTDKLIYTIPIVVYGIFRYLHSIYVKGEGEPSDIVLSDMGLIASVLLWGISVLIILMKFAS